MQEIQHHELIQIVFLLDHVLSVLAQTYDNDAQTYVDDHKRGSRSGHLGYPINSGRVIQVSKPNTRILS